VLPEDRPTFALLERDAVVLQLGGAMPPGRRGIDRRARCGSRPTPGLVTVEWGPEVYADGRREFAIRDPDGKLVILSGETDDPVRPDD
jgi:hypothetical protein